MPVFIDETKHRNAFGEFPEIVVDDSWPAAHLRARPRDELGAAILAYAAKWKDHPDFPPSPWDTRRGDIYLPDLDQPRASTDPIPRWRLKEAAFLGCNLFNAGQEVNFPGYPVSPHTVEPINTSAELVLSYQVRFGTNRKLAGSPHQSGRLHFPNPALAGSPVSPVMRWAGAA